MKKVKKMRTLPEKRRRIDGKTLMKDERAVSPVIGVILMIAITVVIAAVVASFAYGIIGGVAKAPNAALVIEDARVGNTNITVIHHGGDTIVDAFNAVNPTDWKNLIVKHNGLDITWTTGTIVTLGGDTDPDFESGEQLEINITADVGATLASGDTITVVYTETGDLMQRVKVA